MPLGAPPSCDTEATLLARAPYVIGIDEVGRGALAGPVCVGAVLLTTATPPPRELRDSKELTASARETVATDLATWCDRWSLGSASANEIDRWGLRVALALASWRAIATFPVSEAVVIIDGPLDLLHPPLLPLEVGVSLRPTETVCVVGGDAVVASVAAASVLAKVARDAEMVALSSAWPAYQWNHNKGYGTLVHRQALARWGPTPHHRTTWRLLGPGTDPLDASVVGNDRTASELDISSFDR